MAKRLVGLGMYTETPCENHYPIREVNVTEAFAIEWDADMLNRVYLSRAVIAAVQDKTEECGGLSVNLRFKGRIFWTCFAKVHLGSVEGAVLNKEKSNDATY